MTTDRPIAPLRRRLLAAFAGLAMLAQMALPAMHALEIGGPAVEVAATAAAPDAAPALAAQDAAKRGHDAASCPACQSLLRTGPVLASGVAKTQPTVGPHRSLPTAPPSAESTAARTGHPPRAPPALPLA